jgi:hypothetical protein
VTAFDFAYFALPFISSSLHHRIVGAELETEKINGDSAGKRLT